MHTKFIPLVEYSFCNFSKVFSTLIFFDTLDSIVSMSKGSTAAKTIASISLCPSFVLDGKFKIFFFLFFF